MAYEQDWNTDIYRGMEVHVTALERADGKGWDFSVRIAQPGEDASAEGELTDQSGDDGDYPSMQAAIEAGFRRAYAMVDELLA